MIRGGLTAAVLLLGVAVASADASTITYDTVLASPSANPSDPGWYNGSGNPQGGFTVVTDNGIEVGLRAKHRQDPNVIHTPDNVYQVVAGPQSGTVTNRAWWNYEWSIDLQPAAAGDLVLSDFLQYSTMTIQDLTVGASATVSLPYWSDNSYWGPTGKQDGNAGNNDGADLLATSWGVQNSESPSFGDFPLLNSPGYAFNMFNEDYYRITLDVKNSTGTVLASNSIDVRVGDAPAPVPEPTTMVLLGTGILGAGARYRRRRNQKAC
jgi:hypothetical protein